MAPRPAATVIVVRDGPAPGEPLEFLLLRRAAASRFAPGFVVFPGGTVDPEDRSLAGRWFGRSDPEAASAACAIRELIEEAGLALVGTSLRPAGDGEPGSPSAGALILLSRWVAPEFLPIRFDARFYAVAAPRGLDPVPDGVEIDRAWWSPASTALEAGRSGTGPLMWPTLRMLEALAGCRTVEEVLALRVEQVEPPLPRAAP